MVQPASRPFALSGLGSCRPAARRTAAPDDGFAGGALRRARSNCCRCACQPAASAAASVKANTTAKTGRARGKGKATPIPPADKVHTHVGGKEICLNYNRGTCTTATCPNKFVHVCCKCQGKHPLTECKP
eukprot:SAG11_NODE_2005_length_3930_cov_28.915166_5_plen_130_part_00